MKKSRIMIHVGFLLILAAFLLSGYNFYDEHRAAKAAEKAVAKLAESLVEEQGSGRMIPDYLLNPQMSMPIETIDGVEYIGVLQIPALQLELPVISDWSYRGLKLAPCRYYGSAYTDDLVICGHNYPAHFGNLKNLKSDDEIIFIDMDGNIFRYKIAEQEVLASNDISDMTDGDWDLTLFTCTIGGQNRLAIRCEKNNIF